MARLTEIYTCDEKCGRDSGKQFFITEMPPPDALDWGYRAALILVNAGINIPDNAMGYGMMSVVSASISGMTGRIDWQALKPLLDELMECVQIIPDTKSQNVRRGLILDDIDEPLTIAKLQKEVFTLHAGFLMGGGQ